jgi:hypothetical protein
MVLATFNCFQIPVDVAFAPESFEKPYFKAINGLIDFFFFLDIVVSFRTTFMDDKLGVEVNDTKRMALVYFKGQFCIDVLATIPFDTIAAAVSEQGSSAGFKLLGALKLV